MTAEHLPRIDSGTENRLNHQLGCVHRDSHARVHLSTSAMAEQQTCSMICWLAPTSIAGSPEHASRPGGHRRYSEAAAHHRLGQALSLGHTSRRTVHHHIMASCHTDDGNLGSISSSIWSATPLAEPGRTSELSNWRYRYRGTHVTSDMHQRIAGLDRMH